MANRGMASVSHQVAIRRAIPAMMVVFEFGGPGSAKKTARKKKVGPRISPTFFMAFFLMGVVF